MAEHLFKKMLGEAGKNQVRVGSVGVSPSTWLDFPQEARLALEEEGVTGIHHKAQGLTEELAANTDLFLVMEKYHQDQVIKKFPMTEKKVFLLNSYVGLGDQGIPDPFGQSGEVYKKTLADIKKALEKLLEKLEA